MNSSFSDRQTASSARAFLFASSVSQTERGIRCSSSVGAGRAVAICSNSHKAATMRAN